MGKLMRFRVGDFSEQLAFNAFSYIGFVASVPRESDLWLVDQVVQVADLRDKKSMNPSGFAFNVQVKSNKKIIKIKTESQITTFHEMALPFFIAYVNTKKDLIELYSTVARHFIKKEDVKKPIELKLGGDRYQVDSSERKVKINLGKPFAAIKINELRCSAQATPHTYRTKVQNLIVSWCGVELRANYSMKSGLPFLWLPNRDIDTDDPIDKTEADMVHDKTFGKLSEDLLGSAAVWFSVMQRDFFRKEGIDVLRTGIYLLNSFVGDMHRYIENENTPLTPAVRKKVADDYLNLQLEAGNLISVIEDDLETQAKNSHGKAAFQRNTNERSQK